MRPSSVVRRTAATVTAACGALAVVSAGASAATPALTQCHASVARVTTAPLTVDPFAANPGSGACIRDAFDLLSTTSIGPVSASAANAVTYRGSGWAQGSVSAASASAFVGGLSVRVDKLQSTAGLNCFDGRDQAYGNARVSRIVINGKALTIPSGDSPYRVALGATGEIDLNRAVIAADGSSVLEQAVWIHTPVGDAAIGESFAAAGADCAQPADATPPSHVVPPAATGAVNGAVNTAGRAICANQAVANLIGGCQRG